MAILARVDHRVLLVKRALLVIKDLLAETEALGHPVCLVPRVNLALLKEAAEKDRYQALLALQALWVLWVCKVLRVSRVKEVTKARRVNRAIKERVVIMDQWDYLDLLAHQDPKEIMET